MEKKIEELLEKYPYLQKVSETSIFVEEKDIDEIKNGESITVFNKKVYVEFLKRILSEDSYYDYAYKYFTDETTNFSICYIINGDTSGNISYNKSTIIKGLDILIESGELKLDTEMKKRYDALKSGITLEVLKEKYNGTSYECTIDGISYTFPIEDLIAFFNTSDEEFDRLCGAGKEINGVLNIYVAYAALEFFQENDILNNYLLPNEAIRHFKEIESCQKLDIESLNSYIKTNETKYKEVNIDEELKNEILSLMPDDLTPIEKAIYIYIMMCKKLTYDDEYYAVNQKGIATVKHRDINYISKITKDNNKVVCFEFNVIYSKFLSELNIDFISEYRNLVGENYGDAHASMLFRKDKFIVFADSVTSILHGDLMRAKVNEPLVGLKCVNRSAKTRREFQDMVTNIYKLVSSQVKGSNVDTVEHEITLDELMEEYSKVTNSVEDISFEDRVSILINKVNSLGMVGIDSLSYVLQLGRILFTAEQRAKNVKITIIRNNEPDDKDRVAMASAIITLNPSNYIQNDNNTYYYFNPNHELIIISKDKLQGYFTNNVFEYINTNDSSTIPGIIPGKKIGGCYR